MTASPVNEDLSKYVFVYFVCLVYLSYIVLKISKIYCALMKMNNK